MFCGGKQCVISIEDILVYYYRNYFHH